MEGTGRHGKPQMLGLGGPEVRGPWSVVDSSVHAHRARGAHPLFFSLGLGWVGLEVVCFLRRCVMPWNDWRLLGELGEGGGGGQAAYT